MDSLETFFKYSILAPFSVKPTRNENLRLPDRSTNHFHFDSLLKSMGGGLTRRDVRRQERGIKAKCRGGGLACRDFHWQQSRFGAK